MKLNKNATSRWGSGPLAVSLWGEVGHRKNMPRVYKKRVDGPHYAEYSNEKLEEALTEMKRGVSARKVSEKYKIPRTTLQRRSKGLQQKKYGGQTVLSDEEEQFIVEGLLACAEWGFPLGTKDIRIVVKGYLDRQGRGVTLFKNNMPGNEWVRLFLIRHKNLSVRFGENIKRVRAEVSTGMINQYFDNLGASILGIEPSSIVNYDETNFSDDPGKKKYIVKRGAKHPENIIDHSKTSISVMMAAAASGILLPPYVVYKAEHVYPTWIENGPDGTRYNRNKSGWFDGPIFEDWFFQIALPYFKKQPEPRVLIGDNLSSHLSANVLQACNSNNIRFVLLPPNSTHLCQPLDVAFFGPLKKKWRQVLLEWKTKNRGVLPKSDFPRLLKHTLNELDVQKYTNIKSGFEATGIHPLNRHKVLEKLPDFPKTPNPTTSMSTATVITDSFMDFLKNARRGDKTAPKKRGKRLKIESGKSVVYVNEEEEGMENANIDPLDLPLEDPLEDSESRDEENDPLPSVSTQPELPNPLEPEILSIGDYVLVNYDTEKHNQQYVGKILDVKQNEGRYQVMFLRKIVGIKLTYFTYPNIDDIDDVGEEKILYKLKTPKSLRRGRLVFAELKKGNFNIV